MNPLLEITFGKALMWTGGAVGVLCCALGLLLCFAWLHDLWHRRRPREPRITLRCDARDALASLRRAERAARRQRWIQKSRPQLPDPKPQTLKPLSQ